MNRFSQTHTTSTSHLISTYHSGPHDTITNFIQKRFTRFQQPSESKPTYLQILQTNKQKHNFLPQSLTQQQFTQQSINLGVDSFYLDFFNQHLANLSPPQKQIILFHELSEIKQDKAYFNEINRILISRRQCLKQLKYVLQQTIKESIARLSELDKLCMILIHLRVLTLLLVETIYNWNHSLATLLPEPWKQDIKYEHENIETFKLICEDTDFLRDTLLRRYVKFVKGSDPLLIRMTKRKREISLGRAEDGERFSDFFQPDFNILARLKQAENVLIKYHSGKDGKGGREDWRRKIEDEKDSFADIVTVETKNIESQNVIDMENLKINLPKLVAPVKIKKQNPNRIIGTITKHKKQSSPPHLKIQQDALEPTNPIPPLTPPHHSTPCAQSLLPQKPKSKTETTSKPPPPPPPPPTPFSKLNFLKQYLLSNNPHILHHHHPQTFRPNIHLQRHPSSANLITQSSPKINHHSIPFIPGILPTLSETKKPFPSPQYKRRKEKQEKLKFLKEIYRDKSKERGEFQTSLERGKGVGVVKRRRKGRKGEGGAEAPGCKGKCQTSLGNNPESYQF